MSDRIRVVLVDDDQAELDCLVAQLSTCDRIQCVGQFSSYEDAEPQLANLGADVVLLDLTLRGGKSGIESLRAIKTNWPRMKVVILSNSEAKEDFFSAISARTDGYLVKARTHRQELIQKVQLANDGKYCFSDVVIAVIVVGSQKLQDLLPRLTGKETQVLDLRQQGLSYKQIGDQMKISENTVKQYIKKICDKSASDSTAEAAFRRRILMAA